VIKQSTGHCARATNAGELPSVFAPTARGRADGGQEAGLREVVDEVLAGGSHHQFFCHGEAGRSHGPAIVGEYADRVTAERAVKLGLKGWRFPVCRTKPASDAIDAVQLSHRYPGKVARHQVSLELPSPEPAGRLRLYGRSLASRQRSARAHGNIPSSGCAPASHEGERPLRSEARPAADACSRPWPRH
jgi:hypothetical protein